MFTVRRFSRDALCLPTTWERWEAHWCSVYALQNNRVIPVHCTEKCHEFNEYVRWRWPTYWDVQPECETIFSRPSFEQIKVGKHFEQWLKKAVRMDLEQLENYPYHASKSAKNYLLRFVTSNILGAVVKKSSPPNKVMYNDHTGIDRLHECFLGKNHVNCLILTYRQAFSRACGSNMVGTIKSGTKSNFCSFFL